MSGTKHAILSPSASHIWLRCTKSPRLCEDLPDLETEYARQGTQAHSLCQYKLEKALGWEAKDPRAELDLLDDQMEACSDDYVQYVMQLLSELRETCSDPVVLIEQRLGAGRLRVRRLHPGCRRDPACHRLQIRRRGSGRGPGEQPDDVLCPWRDQPAGQPV